jgi:putative transposase
VEGTRHSEEQIIAILKQGEAGVTTAELCRQHGIGGLGTHELRCR